MSCTFVAIHEQKNEIVYKLDGGSSFKNGQFQFCNEKNPVSSLNYEAQVQHSKVVKYNPMTDKREARIYMTTYSKKLPFTALLHDIGCKTAIQI